MWVEAEVAVTQAGGRISSIKNSRSGREGVGRGGGSCDSFRPGEVSVASRIAEVTEKVWVEAAVAVTQAGGSIGSIKQK